MDSRAYWWGQAANRYRPRPAPVQQPPITPWDPNDPDGTQVHTSPPPEWQPPKPFTDPLWPRADMGIDIPGMIGVPGGSSNTDLVCTFMLPQYQNAGGRSVVDRILKAYCQRSYDSYLLDRYCGTDLAGWGTSKFLDLVAYVQGLGLFTPIWFTSSSDGRYDYASMASRLDPLFAGLRSRKLAKQTVCIVGEELNNNTSAGAPLDDLITQTAKRANDLGMPVALHFTAEVGAWPANGAMSFPDWWNQWGPGQPVRVHALWYQANPWALPGYTGARMYDWRRILASASPEFRFTPYEYLLSRRFNNAPGGQPPDRHEVDSRRLGAELSWTTRLDPNVPANSGFGDGASEGDGTPI